MRKRPYLSCTKLSCTKQSYTNKVKLWVREPLTASGFKPTQTAIFRPHVHGFYAGTQVIVEMVGGTARVAHREKSVLPRNAKQSDVNRIVRAAVKHSDELMELWRAARG
jgi:hypothetical protein